MNNTTSNQTYYPAIHQNDQQWGITVTSCGFQSVEPFESYPPSGHPETHNFNFETGRILDEFQLIYITKNRGIFSTNLISQLELKEGNLFMLFPGEWHTYKPAKETGWQVYWVGFKGPHSNQLISENYFSPENPIFNVGYNDELLNLFQQILHHSSHEKPGYQQLLGGIIFHMLGYLHHLKMNAIFSNKAIIPIINKAKLLMRENVKNNTGPEEIAGMLNLSYSSFRQSFKKYTGFTPGQYMNQLKIQTAKDLLSQTNYSVKEIANTLSFESADYFSVFFKRYMNISPLNYRSRNQPK